MSKRLPITLNTDEERNIQVIQDRIGLESKAAAIRWALRHAAWSIRNDVVTLLPPMPEKKVQR